MLYWSMGSLSETIYLKESDSASQQLLVVSNSCARNGSLWAYLSSMLGYWLCQSYAYSNSCCVFMCATSLPCLPNTVPLQMSITFAPYNLSDLSSTMIPESWERKYNIDVLLRAEHSKVSDSLWVEQLWVCMNHHLLGEGKLLWWEVGDVFNLWV